MNTEKIREYEGPIAMVYCALILVLMEYFFLPFRVEKWLAKPGFTMWTPPSLDAGLIWAASCFVGFLLIPVMIVKFVLKYDPLMFGFSTKDFFKHMRIYLGLYIFMIPLIYMAFLRPEFSTLYPFIPSVKQSLPDFLIWEAAYILQFFCLEFFFRGYILYTLEKHMNRWLAIAVMVVPYTMIHFHKPPLECIGAIFAGFVLGHLSLKYRTWLGGAVLHSLVAVTIDSLSAHSAGLF